MTTCSNVPAGEVIYKSVLLDAKAILLKHGPAMTHIEMEESLWEAFRHWVCAMTWPDEVPAPLQLRGIPVRSNPDDKPFRANEIRCYYSDGSVESHIVGAGG